MFVRSLVTFACVALFLVSGSGASTIEEATGHAVAYQFDAGSHRDAPDACALASAEWTAPVDASTDGILVAPDDLADVFLVDVPATLVGGRLDVRVNPAPGQDLDVNVFVPGCAGDVFDPMNQPAPEPSPPQPSAGEAQSDVQNLGGSWQCDATRWFFVVNQLRGIEAPASIHAAWTDGSQQSVPLLQASDGTAFYAVADHVSMTLRGAWINLPDSWSGNFRIGAGPCDAVDGGAVYGPPPVVEMGAIAFTPIHAGPHVVQVTYRGAAGNVLPPIPADAGPDDLASTMPGPIVMPASCHYCRGEVEYLAELVSYQVTVMKA